MIKNIVFDLGKVLVDFHPTEGMKKMGFSKEAINCFEKNIFSGLWEECDRNPLGDKEIRALFKQRVKGYEREVDMLWDNLWDVTGVYAYSHEWILSLKKRGYKVFILSNFGQRSFEINSHLYTFLEDVDGLLISYEIGKIKPEPEIYEALLERYSFSAKESVFIDDRKINVDAAILCGMKGIVFDGYEKTQQKLNRLLEEQD